MADNKFKAFLVDKLQLANIADTGKIEKNQTSKPEDKVYILKRESDENQSRQSTSPNDNINVLYLKDDNTGKLHYSADTVKKYTDLKREGNMPKGMSLHQEPVGEYIQKQFSTYKISFEKAIRSNGNENLPLVMSYIQVAYQKNDQVALGKMVQLIKDRENFDFIFSGGKLDLKKINNILKLSNSDIVVGIDNLENNVHRDISYRTGAERIADAANGILPQIPGDKISDSKIDELYKNAVELNVADIQRQDDNKEKNTASNRVADGLGKFRKTVVNGLGTLAGVISGVGKDDNNSLENIFSRSSLGNKNELEDKSKLEKEREEEKQKVEALKRKAEKGKKLTKDERQLLEKDRVERIRLAQENNSINKYIVSDEVKANIDRVGREIYERQQGEVKKTQGPEER